MYDDDAPLSPRPAKAKTGAKSAGKETASRQVARRVGKATMAGMKRFNAFSYSQGDGKRRVFRIPLTFRFFILASFIIIFLMLLALNNAMVAAYKAENFIDAAGFASRILAHPEAKSPRNAALEQKARKVLQRSEKEGRNAVDVGLRLQPPFEIDAKALAPIGKNEDRVQCPYCGATYRPEAAKTLCEVCELATVGVETVGLVCVDARS